MSKLKNIDGSALGSLQSLSRQMCGNFNKRLKKVEYNTKKANKVNNE